jgi:hypothetical protein
MMRPQIRVARTVMDSTSFNVSLFFTNIIFFSNFVWFIGYKRMFEDFGLDLPRIDLHGKC